MSNRTMVKAERMGDYIYFRTVSRARKSPGDIGISLENILRLKEKSDIIVNDGSRFALLGHNEGVNLVKIVFFWMRVDGDGTTVNGWRQEVMLPYESLMEFAEREPCPDGDSVWKALSQDEPLMPRLVFDSYRNLQAVIAIPMLRHRLFAFLSKRFHWPDSSEIRFSDDFTPHSFLFETKRRTGGSGMCGGVILHNQEDLRKSYYGVHT